MSFRSNPDGSHYPLSGGAFDHDAFQRLKEQDKKRAVVQKSLETRKVNTDRKMVQARMQAFAHYLKERMDPRGLEWVIVTGRMSSEDEHKLAEGLGTRISKDFRLDLWHHLYNTADMNPSKKVVGDKKLVELAEYFAKEIGGRYPLYAK